MHYVFQQSKIWEAGNPVDQSAKPIKIKAKNLTSALKQLHKKYGRYPSVGRVWVEITYEKD